MNSKIIIYQIFTRLYGNRNLTRMYNGSILENGCGKMNFFTLSVLKEIKKLGITHVWYTGVIRHATKTDYSGYGIPVNHKAVVKGNAGSPYAITDYYDIDPDLAENVGNRMEEFDALLKRTHKSGLKVIIDFVPNHVARQYHSIAKPAAVVDLGENDNVGEGFSPRNNFYYCPGCRFHPDFDLHDETGKEYMEEPAKATGNDCFGPNPGVNDWYETVKLNYGVDYYAGRIGYFNPVPDTWKKMLDILLFWAGKGVDAFRCDMAEMVPAAFWKWATGKVREAYPEILFIGEVYNPAEYRNYISSGFDYLYDKVGMYDTMRAVICGAASASAITGAWQATDDIESNMLYFLENHDEQRVASRFFAGDGLKAVPALVVNALMRRNPFMLYAGEEYGEKGMDVEGFSGCDGRTTIFDYWSIDTLCRAENGGLTEDERRLYDIHVKVLNIAHTEKAVGEGAFFDLMYVNGHSEVFNPDRQYAFLRKCDDSLLIVVANFDSSDVDIELTIPAHAFDCLALKGGLVMASDILNGSKRKLNLVKDGRIPMRILANGAAVWKIKLS
ncbi:alpha-amylase [Prevotella sp. PMUR]|uniref:Alpha-amylase n=1 Tax=Xylanibacter muris TaxID=2736290 RepID=A0ABX2ALV6_9BACT|nr:alpha-amylase [Xylanibacter muris]